MNGAVVATCGVALAVPGGAAAGAGGSAGAAACVTAEAEAGDAAAPAGVMLVLPHWNVSEELITLIALEKSSCLELIKSLNTMHWVFNAPHCVSLDAHCH